MTCHRLRTLGIVFAAMVPSLAGPAVADGLPDRNRPTLQALPGITWEVGSRTWYSTGDISKDLFNTTGSLLISRLSYDDLTAVTAEGFFRGDHSSGLFVKGYIGGGSVLGGKLHDEDFPPVVAPYSNTISDQKHGNLTYWSIDLGYTFWDTSKRYGGIKDGGVDGPGHRVGAFIGYHYWRERLNTFGCAQVGGAGSGICNPTIPGTQNALDNEAIWRSLRLGAVGDWYLAPRLKVTGEVAYVRTQLDNTDFHNFRPDIKGIKEDGTGDGVQAEIIVSYAVTDALSVGVGGRWWHLRTDDGHSHFENTAAGGNPQVVKFETDRYGAFLQGTYKLNGVEPGRGSVKDGCCAAFNWNGFYAGLNTGYAWGTADPGITSNSALGNFFILNGDVPIGTHYDTAGYFAGGQVGFNVRMGRFLLGVEADIDWARITGTESITKGVNVLNTSIDQRVDWFGTVRGRAGIVPTDSLMLFVTAGLAYGDTRLSANVVGPVGFPCTVAFTCSFGSSSGTSTGWTVGTGFEYALSNRITVKGEYLYVDLGDRSVQTRETATGGTPPSIFTVKSDFDFHVLRTGLNFKF